MRQIIRASIRARSPVATVRVCRSESGFPRMRQARLPTGDGRFERSSEPTASQPGITSVRNWSQLMAGAFYQDVSHRAPFRLYPFAADKPSSALSPESYAAGLQVRHTEYFTVAIATDIQQL